MDKDLQYSPDSKYKYWVYDHEGDGMVFYKSEESRNKAMEEAIAEYLDDGWSEEVIRVCAGVVTHVTIQTDLVKRPPEEELEDNCDKEGTYWGNFDYMCNYKPLSIEGGK